MIVLDASVLIAHFSSADAHHEAADAFLVGAVDEELRIHSLTLAEVLAGAGRTGPAERRQAEVEALGVRVLASDDAEPVRLAKLRAEYRTRMPDCCVLSAAIATNGAIATFDRQLSRIAAELSVSLAISV